MFAQRIAQRATLLRREAGAAGAVGRTRGVARGRPGAGTRRGEPVRAGVAAMAAGMAFGAPALPFGLQLPSQLLAPLLSGFGVEAGRTRRLDDQRGGRQQRKQNRLSMMRHGRPPFAPILVGEPVAPPAPAGKRRKPR